MKMFAGREFAGASLIGDAVALLAALSCLCSVLFDAAWLVVLSACLLLAFAALRRVETGQSHRSGPGC